MILINDGVPSAVILLESCRLYSGLSECIVHGPLSITWGMSYIHRGVELGS